MREKNLTKRRVGLFIIALGILFMLYPLTPILYNSLMGTRRIEEFRRAENEMDVSTRGSLLSQAQSYNESLSGTTEGVVDPFDVKNYSTVNPLDYGDGDVFGYISVPKIDELLPIYLGASDYHLSIGVAQVDGTDLPIGGVNTRSVIAGHRGYTTHRIFKNLDKLEKGDLIVLEVLGEQLEYEVYGSEIIEPYEYEKLAVVPEQDTLTLLTCTPFLIGTERLLVNAVRINAPVEVVEAAPEVVPEAEPVAAVRTVEPNSDVMFEKYALMGIVAFLMLMLVIVVSKFIRTFKG